VSGLLVIARFPGGVVAPVLETQTVVTGSFKPSCAKSNF
jgi:hypothetical protein